jgi:hypothetical protein
MFGTAVTFLKRTSQGHFYRVFDSYLRSILLRRFAPSALQLNKLEARSRK